MNIRLLKWSELMKKCILIANFGGPRTLNEIEPFLRSLLCDQDVVRTGLPKLVHNFLFSRIAKKRALKIANDYKLIGGCSPIFTDTENLAAAIRPKITLPVFTFHRYIPDTHEDFINLIQKEEWDEILVFPLFPQFTYATTGSIARFFDKYLPATLCTKMRWIKSYPTHPSFVEAFQKIIRNSLKNFNINENETHLLFSAHGIPKVFVEKGDLYEEECMASFNAIKKAFPKASADLCFQSKFGKGEWLRPYTSDVCESIKEYAQDKKNVLFIPLSFTSDHIETLFEVEELYLPVVKQKGYNAQRVPALNLNKEWIDGIVKILDEKNLCNNQMLIRRN